MKIRDAVLESITYSLMSYSPLKLTWTSKKTSFVSLIKTESYKQLGLLQLNWGRVDECGGPV